MKVPVYTFCFLRCIYIYSPNNMQHLLIFFWQKTTTASSQAKSVLQWMNSWEQASRIWLSNDITNSSADFTKLPCTKVCLTQVDDCVSTGVPGQDRDPVIHVIRVHPQSKLSNTDINVNIIHISITSTNKFSLL